VGIDGHESGWRALDTATDEAAAHQLPVQIYHFPLAGEDRWAASELLDRALARVPQRRPGVPVDAAELPGTHTSAALAAAVTESDLLVVGVRTKHRLGAKILGSTSSHLLSHPPCDLVVVPPLREPSVRGSFHGHVVAAVDGRPGTGDIMGRAFAEAAAHGCPLAVAHAEPHDAGITGAFFDEDTLETTLRPYPACQVMLQDAIEPWRHQYRDVLVRRACFHGSVPDVLQYIAVGARMMLLGQASHALQPVHHVDALISAGHCPVYVVVARATSRRDETVRPHGMT
jgi:nucleotide-binding universal stress UspA family protein